MAFAPWRKWIFLVAFSVVLVLSEENSPLTQADLDRQKLISALHPFRHEIRATWTRRAMTAQEESQGPLSCNLCSTVLPIAKSWLDTGKYTQGEIRDFVISGCKLLKLAPRPEICEPIITAYTDQFLYIIQNTADNSSSLPSTQICGVLTPDCTQDHLILTNWSTPVTANKPAAVTRAILKATEKQTTKIIQFTDIHMDLRYLEGKNTDCGAGMPICCREEYGEAAPGAEVSGLYGNFRCALPRNTLKEIFIHARDTNPDARFVFLTGDYIHSGVWQYNKEENGNHIMAVVADILEVFKNTNVTIYPLTGNHEPHVVNMYPPDSVWKEKNGTFDLSWLYTATMDPFLLRNSTMIEEAQKNLYKLYGYYTANPEAGLRLIVLNTNLCSTENFWLGFSPYEEVKEELKWLENELHKAELAKEKVLIVGHIEPGSCWSMWSGQFNRVVARYEGIIRGSFFGHSHKPQYRISMENGTMRPVFSSVIAGSALPDSMNPTYSVFHVDGARGGKSEWDVLRHELIVMNLTESNRLRKPVFRKLADSYETFGMPNLSPNSVLQFAKDMICNQTLVDRFLTFHTKGEDSLDRRVCAVADVECMKNILCNIVSSNAADNAPCKNLEKQVRETRCVTEEKESATGQNQLSWTALTLTMLLGLIGRV